MNKRKMTAVVLAAGESRRIRTSTPKVLLDLAGRPLIFYVLEVLSSLKLVDNIIVVLGHNKELVKNVIKDEFKKVNFVVQKKLNGTAKAVVAACNLLNPADDTLIIGADTPLITAATLRKFINFFFKNNLDCALITALFKQESDLGRIIRDNAGFIKAVREVVDIGSSQNEEVNSGIYCFKNNLLFERLKGIKINSKQKEFFLTDSISIFYTNSLKIKGFMVKDNEEILGVNTPYDLIRARKILNQRLLRVMTNRGVLIIDPATTFFSFDTAIGKNSCVYPFTFIEKDVIIGKNCQVGPFIHIRSHSVIKDNTGVGNFLEINRSKIEKNVQIKHFGYLGDTEIGRGVNIGAGTVTANYDGKKKHKTKIHCRAFVGSDTVIVAPGDIGEGATTGAGSVITHPVAAHTVVAGVPARLFKKK